MSFQILAVCLYSILQFQNSYIAEKMNQNFALFLLKMAHIISVARLTKEVFEFI